MFVTFTAPHRTSSSSTLDRHSKSFKQRLLPLQKRQTSKAERKKERRETETNRQETQKEGHRRVLAKKDARFQNGRCHSGVGGVSPLHHFGDEAGDGGGGLIRVQLGEQVADIVCCASLFPRDESEKPDEREENLLTRIFFLIKQQHNYFERIQTYFTEPPPSLPHLWKRNKRLL